MRECQVHPVLREHVEGRAFLQDAPEHEVEVLDVRLVARAAGIGELHPDATRDELHRLCSGSGR